MPKHSQLPVISLRDPVAQSPQMPFTLETVRRTVLKFANPLGCHLPSVPDLSEATLTAMQRLVEIINTLRSSQPSFLEGELPQSPGAIAALLPYISEEAYDVLDTLRSENTAISLNPKRSGFAAQYDPQSSNGSSSPHPPIPPSPHPSFITIETLIPTLLWRIARSDYSLMRLIEGVSGRCYQPQGWATGMVRLVVMLELEAPTVRWCFDLATGQPAAGLLESIAIVQMDEPVLPIHQTAHAGADMRDASCQVEHQLQAVFHLLHGTVGLEDFLQRMAVALLQPGSDWQMGELRLRFGFEFSAQASDADSHEAAPEYPEPIEAELMEDSAGITPQRPQRLATPDATIARAMPTSQVSVVHPSGRSLSPATLLRASDTALLERYIQQTNRQQIAQSLCRLHRQASDIDESEQLAIIVQAALAALTSQTSVVGIGLLQPTLLLDELAPKLLWSLTRCTDEMMQLLGGVPAQMLQPGAHWQQGTLRLLAMLQITATNLNDTLDLSTGRSVAVNAAQLAGAIVQSSATALCQQPMPIETLTASLQQRWDGAPEVKLLVDGLAIDWLEDVEQDWQAGTMTLKLSLGFFP